MHIVIDIDENLYTRLFDNGVDNYDDAIDMAKSIRKGTPLVDVLGEIRAEIENDWQLKKYPSAPFSCGLRYAIEIIDKYRAESEVENE